MLLYIKSSKYTMIGQEVIVCLTGAGAENFERTVAGTEAKLSIVHRIEKREPDGAV